jgi:hypothetical protein
MFGAWRTALICSALYLAALVPRIRCENRVLGPAGAPASAPRATPLPVPARPAPPPDRPPAAPAG